MRNIKSAACSCVLVAAGLAACATEDEPISADPQDQEQESIAESKTDLLAPLVAFRFSDVDLRDPHVFVSVPLLGCRDVTDTQILGFAVNNEIQQSVQTDGDDPDTFLDLSPTIVFRSFTQVPGAQAAELHFANCTSPVAGTTCSPGAQAPIPATVTNQNTGNCLTSIPGTIRPYSPAIASTNGPCGVSSPPTTVTLTLAGIPITLRDATVAATYVGNPATSTVTGLLRGFISETDANATTLPADLPLVGGRPLSSILPGGTGNCRAANLSDKDTNNGVVGWWFYLNFPTTSVPWVE